MLGAFVGFWSGCGSAIERSLIYHPTRHIEATPADYGLPHEDVHVTTPDGARLHGWHVPGPRRVTLLYSHGNAGNVSHRLGKLREMRQRLGIGILIFDYRGYGRSTGTPSESGTYADARRFRAWLRDRGPAATGPVVYFGGSLGAAVAAALAVEDAPAALILETPFTSVRAMANGTLPGAGYLFSTRYDTLGIIRRLRAPLLVLHGDADEVVPFRHGRAIFEAAPDPKSFYRIPGARHNDTYQVGGEAYWRAWETFLASTVGS
jgi:fermentation-respiration switch protein FrsA (DUF1100 family)